MNIRLSGLVVYSKDKAGLEKNHRLRLGGGDTHMIINPELLNKNAIYFYLRLLFRKVDNKSRITIHPYNSTVPIFCGGDPGVP